MNGMGKILHTADWNLGNRMGRIARTDQLHKAVERVAVFCTEEKGAVLLRVGDSFSGLGRRPLPGKCARWSQGPGHKSFHDTVMKFLKDELIDHEDADRNAVVRRAEQLIAEETP